MHHHHQQFLHFFLTLLTLIPSSISQPQCPLNFQILQPLTLTTPATCQYILQLIRLLQSDYLSHTNSFSPPDNSSDSCWRSYESVLHDETISTRCGFRFPWISSDCMDVTTRAQFESRVASSDSLTDVVSACNQSLLENSPCASCTTALSSLSSVCTEFSVIYAGAFVNRFGPTDVGTARCLFNLDFTPNSNRTNRRNIVAIIVAVVVCVLVLVICLLVFFVLRRRKINRIRIRRIDESREMVGSGLDSISGSTTLVRYTFEEVKIATRGFSRENMIGKGGYGNVYKGTLEDGTEVAFKRFKNSSAAGDASFTHEVEVIASVRHVNLVGLRGYCTETMALEGYQRIIVCELMRNGSVHDHLFGGVGSKLSWDVRRRIAVGTARGLAYLHYGAQPAIIHRDIKGSNILLDDKFEPKLADFGLAKFTPEGMTHLSTRVAGTMGYVAPEYALYGQVTERSDVYSFGIVLLELLSGKKALMAVGDGQPLLVADWAWSLVRKGKAMEVIEDGMADLGPFEVVEKYVLVAVLCSHPQPYARPTMDQVVKMLDMDVPVPVIPERPISIISSIDDIERSVSSSGSGHFSTSTGYQPYLIEQERGMIQKEDNGNLGDR